MAKVMASGKVDPEVWEWATAYAAERGVSRSSLMEAALRELQASAMGGVPDLGAPAEPEPVVPYPGLEKRTTSLLRPVSIQSPEDARKWAMDRQRKLNAAKERAR